VNNSKFILPQSSFLDKKRLFLETLLNQTDKVSKISENSVLSGIASGISRLTGLIEKDISVYYSKLHPDYASGNDLDILANLYGFNGRLGQSSSSTYILIKADEGTFYDKALNLFISDSNVTFELSSSITIGQDGYEFALVNSQSEGSDTNVSPFSINKLNIEPQGHISCYNETGAIGGRDIEQDDSFRKRIREGLNAIATNTLSSLEQRAIQINKNVLKLIHNGISDIGKIKIGVVCQNGISLNNSELTELSNNISKHLALTDYRSLNRNTYTIEFFNIDFFPIDIEVRCDFDGITNYDTIIIEMQTLIMKYLDWRNWDSLKKNIEWDNLLEICKSVKGVRYINDQYFLPRRDIFVPQNLLPRLRGFKLLNLKGEQIFDSSFNFKPIFYQNTQNKNIIRVL
jgi:hypothetical protein